MRPGVRRPYRDRDEAGRQLAAQLGSYLDRDVIVLALPRGGVPVAAPIARRLLAPLGLVLVRKLGVPGRPELAMGALACVEGQTEVMRNESVIQGAGVSSETFESVRRHETAVLERRVRDLALEPMAVAGRVLVVIDDGLATGSTMLVAVRALRRQQPLSIVVAVPAGSRQAVAMLSAAADTVVCPSSPEPFLAVGACYRDFTQVSDDQVSGLLAEFHPGT